MPPVSPAGTSVDGSEKIPLELPQTRDEGGIFPDIVLDMSKVSAGRAASANSFDISGVPPNNQGDGGYSDSFSMSPFMRDCFCYRCCVSDFNSS